MSSRAARQSPGRITPFRLLRIIAIVGLLAQAETKAFAQDTEKPLPNQIAQPAAELCKRALTAADPEKRINAAVELSMLKTPDAVTQLRRLATETKDAEVLVPALAGLLVRSNVDSLPLFIDALANSDKAVRQVAIQGVLRLTGLSAAEVQYGADDPKEKREKAVRMLKERLQKGKDKPAP